MLTNIDKCCRRGTSPLAPKALFASHLMGCTLHQWLSSILPWGPRTSQNWGAPQMKNPRECLRTHCAHIIHLDGQNLPNGLRKDHLYGNTSLLWVIVVKVFTSRLTVMTADSQWPILPRCEHLEASPLMHNFYCVHQGLPQCILYIL